MDLDIVNQEVVSNPRAIFLFSCFVFKLMGIMLILKRRNKHKLWKNRRWWIRPINLQRDNPSNFIPFMEELKNDADHFFRYTRMTLEIYNNLLEKISPFLKKSSLRKTNSRAAFNNYTKIYLFKFFKFCITIIVYKKIDTLLRCLKLVF